MIIGTKNKQNMSNNKQTAVEWLKKELEDYGSNSHLSLDWNTFDELAEQAKAMEKEQIIDACNLQRNDYKGMPTYNKSGEQYYNETYGGNNEAKFSDGYKK